MLQQVLPALTVSVSYVQSAKLLMSRKSHSKVKKVTSCSWAKLSRARQRVLHRLTLFLPLSFIHQGCGGELPAPAC